MVWTIIIFHGFIHEGHGVGKSPLLLRLAAYSEATSYPGSYEAGRGGDPGYEVGGVHVLCVTCEKTVKLPTGNP